ncbi:MAG TPA: MBL fold metallo-hydrolase [Gammaproteobacteria bacterium]|nr:MBL fold metallo-hydrolase [Gammaproteobacteria bacterium]
MKWKGLNRVLGYTLLVLVLWQGAAFAAGDPLVSYPTDKVAEHTYVIHGPTERPSSANQGFMNNPGFVVTKTSVVVIDSGSSAAIGRALLKKIKKITSKPVSAVFVSHVHGDHWLGNQAILQAYPKAKVYAHPEMIKLAKEGAAETWVELLEKLTDGATKGTKAVIPEYALKDQQVITVGDIGFRVHLSKHAHTTTDAMIEVLGDGVLFTGDNVTFKRIPRMDDGSFRGNIAVVEKAKALDVKVVVPGHGPSGGKNLLDPYQNYLETVYENTRILREEGKEDFEMKQPLKALLKDYQDWPGFDEELGKHISLSVLEAEQAEFE